METQAILEGLIAALDAIKPAWLEIIPATRSAIFLLHAERHIKSQIDEIYAETFNDPDKAAVTQ